MAYAGFDGWYGTYSSDLTVNIEKEKTEKFLHGKLVSINNGILTFYNPYEDKINITKTLVNDKNCVYLNDLLEIGGTEINISSCIDEVDSSYVEILVYTPKGFQEKFIIN